MALAGSAALTRGGSRLVLSVISATWLVRGCCTAWSGVHHRQKGVLEDSRQQVC